MYVKVKKEVKKEVNSEEKVEDDLQKSKGQSDFYYKKLHPVLTYEIVKPVIGSNKIESGCINRDKNSVMNMETIVKELLKSGQRPAVFSRSSNQGNQTGQRLSKASRRKDNISDASGTHRDTVNGKQKRTSKKSKTNKESTNENIKKANNQKRKTQKISQQLIEL
jgi:hypothetical protein